MLPPPDLSSEAISTIEKTAEFKLRKGEAFETLVREKQRGNPQFAFLFDTSSPSHAYYQYKLSQLQQAGHGAVHAPPPPPQPAPAYYAPPMVPHPMVPPPPMYHAHPGAPPMPAPVRARAAHPRALLSQLRTFAHALSRVTHPPSRSPVESLSHVLRRARSRRSMGCPPARPCRRHRRPPPWRHRPSPHRARRSPQ